jgi:CheY-like chemotaxis protein
MNGKCPRCSTPITTLPDARGLVHCTGCGTWLRSVTPAAPPPAALAPEPPRHAAPPSAAPVTAAAPPLAAVPPSPEIQTLIGEIRDLRRMQAEILQLQAQVLTALRSWPPPAPPAAGRVVQRTPGASDEVEILDADEVFAPSAATAPALPRVRQRRKTVLLIDDDPATRRDAMAALEQAQVPARSVDNGQAGMAAIAAEKPDVIVLELDLGEPMPGRDFVSMLKATMEWVDIPLLLHTRLPIDGSKQARIEHGADDYVLKGPGSAEALVNRVIGIFQSR